MLPFYDLPDPGPIDIEDCGFYCIREGFQYIGVTEGIYCTCTNEGIYIY